MFVTKLQWSSDGFILTGCIFDEIAHNSVRSMNHISLPKPIKRIMTRDVLEISIAVSWSHDYNDPFFSTLVTTFT